MRRLKLLFRLSAATVLLVIAGCAVALQPEEYRLIQTSRYSELEKLMESRVNQPSSAPTSQLFFLCYAYSKLKKYNKLFPCLGQLEKNIERGDRNLFIYDFSAYPYLLRAEAYIEFGDYTRAIEESTKAYDLVLKKDLYRQFRIFALAAMGLSHALHGDPGSAKKYAALLEEVGTHYPFNTLETDKLTGLAKVYMALGEFDKSLDAIRRDEGGDLFRVLTDVITGAVLTGDTLWAFNQLPKAFILNKSLFETGQVQQAKEGYDQLLKRPETKYNGDIYWLILFDRGRIAEKEGPLKEAIEFYKQAIDVIEQQRSTIHTEANKIGYVGDKQKVYHHLITALISEGQQSKAFEYVERSKSRALVDLLASKKEFAVQKGDETKIRSMLKDLEILESGARVQEAPSVSDHGDRRRSLEIQIKEKLKSSSPELASLVTVMTVEAPEVQSLIQSDETLLEYYYHGDELYAFVLTQNTLRAEKLKSPNLITEIAEFRKSLEDPQSREYLRLSQQLYQRLLAPIEPLLIHQNLILAPQGVLHYIPFSALNGGSGYLIDRYSIRLLPSASVMSYLKERKVQRSERLLAFGNPDLDDPRFNLRYAQEEAVAIAKGFPQAKLLLRKEATETAFKKTGEEFSYIHFATHGFFESESPLNSGLFLAGDSENDGLLTVGELYSLRLHADLVTLSACETGLGKINYGDDLVGLSRGFLYAGSNSILASLWKVEDRATSFLMTEFYSNLKKANKRDALREAQLTTKKLFEHPFFWAAFQLTGMAH
ncbi:MAG: CHAT domain-containing protein [Deltaproteobacteria bacterium]|nr:CHAT domain-containing protein [Deltaproteobacteria bacterium]